MKKSCRVIGRPTDDEPLASLNAAAAPEDDGRQRRVATLHITTDSPPQLRIDGNLVKLKTEPLTADETKQLCYSVLTDAQKAQFEEDNELDLSFGVKGLARFRANVFVQQGAVGGAFRLIPFKIRTLRRAGPAADRRRAVQEAARAHPRHRPDRLGQVDDAGGDDRQDQHRRSRPHHHHRGSDRVPARAQELRRQPARGRRRHALVQEGAQVDPAPGPGRRPRRRAARPRDHRGGADHRRDRPPLLRHAAHQRRRLDHQPHHRRLPAYQQPQIRAQLSFVLEGVLSQSLVPKPSAAGARSRSRS